MNDLKMTRTTIILLQLALAAPGLALGQAASADLQFKEPALGYETLPPAQILNLQYAILHALVDWDGYAATRDADTALLKQAGVTWTPLAAPEPRTSLNNELAQIRGEHNNGAGPLKLQAMAERHRKLIVQYRGSLSFKTSGAAASGSPASTAGAPAGSENKTAAVPPAQEDPSKLLEGFLKTKLSADDQAAFVKDLAAAKTPADRDFILSAYLAKAAPKIGKGELAGLEKPTRKSVCSQLAREVNTDISPEFKTKLDLDLLKAIDLKETDFDTNKPVDNSHTVKAPKPQLASRSGDLKRLNTDCLALNDQDLRDDKKTAGNLAAKVPAADQGGSGHKPGLFGMLSAKLGGLFHSVAAGAKAVVHGAKVVADKVVGGAKTLFGGLLRTISRVAKAVVSGVVGVAKAIFS